ncbi:MAG: sugar transferase [Candidatus Aminicenantales bacterium]|jgi:exopolysaccharide biosynthesis polyprenyl glycosylphosphotransferase
MLKEREAITRAFLVFIDILVVSLAYLVAFILRKKVGLELASSGWPVLSHATADYSLTFSRYIGFLAVAAPLGCWMLYFNGMYRSIRTLSYLSIVSIVCKSVFMTSLGFGAFLFLIKTTFVSRFFFVLFAVTSLVLIMVEKTIAYMAMHYVRRRGRSFRRLLIVGTGPRAAAFIRRIKAHPEWGFHILGAIDDEPGRGIKKVDGVDIIGVLDDIPKILHSDAVDEIVFVIPRSRLSHVEGALHDCETEGVVTTITVDLFDMQIAKSAVSEIDGIPLLSFHTIKINEWELLVKRFIDIVISGLIMALMGPFLALLALLIKLSSPGPVFFKQQRLGYHGRKFTLYKFRTMRQGAQDALPKVNDVAEMDTPEFREKKTKWITPLGRVMRKFSLDELPQFFNVLIGHMSLIGPRPTVPDEVEQYKAWQRRRFSMKPGITCLWQVNGRNNIGFEDWMKLDLEYLDNWSLWLDMKIMIKTVPVVLFGIGAY